MNLPQIITDNQVKVKGALEDWTRWLGINDLVEGYPSRSAVLLCDGGAWGNFVDDQAEEQFVKNAEAVDAIIDPKSNLMTISQRLAVYHFHTGAVWKSNRTNIEDDYAEALFILEINLRKRNLL